MIHIYILSKSKRLTPSRTGDMGPESWCYFAVSREHGREHDKYFSNKIFPNKIFSYKIFLTKIIFPISFFWQIFSPIKLFPF